MTDKLKNTSSPIIHKEGMKIILFTGIFLIIVNFCFYYFNHKYNIINILITSLSVIFYLLVVLFFRVPKRVVICDSNTIIAPADGKVVVIEKTFENEYFNDYRTQVSIFMSPLNVHVNWAPVSGNIQYIKYHPGSYMVAWKPKASEENERFTTVFRMHDNTEILMRQIAGKLARRIVSYAAPKMKYEQGEQLGIIKFGSRVDVFLPPDAKINVQLNQKVRGKRSIIAEL
jgi:phosphatidylserine decarboxylase